MAYPRPFIRDISKYDAPPYNNAPIPWEDYDGLIIRCYDGTDPDPAFLVHRTQAIAHGKAWWPYMFYDFRVAAAGQVTEALSVLGDDHGHAPLCIDVEEWGGFRFPERSVLLNSLKVLYDEYVSLTGYKPIWYFSAVAVIHDHLIPVPEWLKACPLWDADWRWMTPEYDPWATWLLHQYQGEPDLNQFNGGLERYINWLLVPPPDPIDIPPGDAPESVIVKVANVNLRSEPTSRRGALSVIGYTTFGKRLYPEAIEKDENGYDWYKLGKAVYIAAWLTRLP